MTRKISGHDGDLVVTDAVELDGDVAGRLVVEPGGSVVINGSLVGNTLTVGEDAAPNESSPIDEHVDEHVDEHIDHPHPFSGDLGSVISDIP